MIKEPPVKNMKQTAIQTSIRRESKSHFCWGWETSKGDQAQLVFCASGKSTYSSSHQLDVSIRIPMRAAHFQEQQKWLNFNMTWAWDPANTRGHGFVVVWEFEFSCCLYSSVANIFLMFSTVSLASSFAAGGLQVQDEDGCYVCVCVCVHSTTYSHSSFNPDGGSDLHRNKL